MENEYVYVNQDGTVRELCSKECAYLSEKFAPFDGGRPYIKSIYEARDGYDSLSGFILRRMVPPNINVQPVNPQYDSLARITREDTISDYKTAGDIVETNADRSTITITPNPHITKEERFEILRHLQLERQSKTERFARHPDYL